VPRVSNVLGALRLADMVRYDSDGKRNYYRLKHPGEIRQVLAALSPLVDAVSKVARATASHCILSMFSEFTKTWRFASNADTDHHCLVSSLCGFSEVAEFQQAHRRWVDDSLTHE
jgi:hypothetical protein